jgi:hypothetical protein
MAFHRKKWMLWGDLWTSLSSICEAFLCQCRQEGITRISWIHSYTSIGSTTANTSSVFYTFINKGRTSVHLHCKYEQTLLLPQHSHRYPQNNHTLVEAGWWMSWFHSQVFVCTYFVRMYVYMLPSHHGGLFTCISQYFQHAYNLVTSTFIYVTNIVVYTCYHLTMAIVFIYVQTHVYIHTCMWWAHVSSSWLMYTYTYVFMSSSHLSYMYTHIYIMAIWISSHHGYSFYTCTHTYTYVYVMSSSWLYEHIHICMYVIISPWP